MVPAGNRTIAAAQMIVVVRCVTTVAAIAAATVIVAAVVESLKSEKDRFRWSDGIKRQRCWK